MFSHPILIWDVYVLVHPEPVSVLGGSDFEALLKGELFFDFAAAETPFGMDDIVTRMHNNST